MSVAFNSKLGEVGEENLMATESKYVGRSRSSVCWIAVAAVGLGLLLLIVILVAQNTSTINQSDKKYTDLIYEITKGRDNLRDERDQLQSHANNLTAEMQILQDRYSNVVASRDELQEVVNNLSPNRTEKTCHTGWTEFKGSCYYSSNSGVSKSWENSRKDCQERGADLVIITTREELNFVKKAYGVTWIGLSRVGDEDRWRWVDGTDLVGDVFWQPGEPNNSDGEENCVEVSRDASAWNDVPCRRKFSFMCEY